MTPCHWVQTGLWLQILTFSCSVSNTNKRTWKSAIKILSLLTWSCITWQLSNNLISKWRNKEECYWYSPSQNCNQSTVQTSPVDNQEYPKTGCGQRLHLPGPRTQRTYNMYSTAVKCYTYWVQTTTWLTPQSVAYLGNITKKHKLYYINILIVNCITNSCSWNLL